MNTKIVECVVLVSHLTLGTREGHMQKVTYKEGDTIDLPLSLAEELGTSVRFKTEQTGKVHSVPVIAETRRANVRGGKKTTR